MTRGDDDRVLGAGSSPSPSACSASSSPSSGSSGDERVVAAHRADDVRPRAQAFTLAHDRREGISVAACTLALLSRRRLVPSGSVGSAPARGSSRSPRRTAVRLQIMSMLVGLAFGLVFMSSPAIVLYFVLPTLWGILTAIIAARRRRELAGPRAPTTDPSEGGVSGTGWARRDRHAVVAGVPVGAGPDPAQQARGQVGPAVRYGLAP